MHRSLLSTHDELPEPLLCPLLSVAAAVSEESVLCLPQLLWLVLLVVIVVMPSGHACIPEPMGSAAVPGQYEPKGHAAQLPLLPLPDG